jgi:hypothetical protein
MPSGAVASPPWVSGSWASTAWEAETWGIPVSYAGTIRRPSLDLFASGSTGSHAGLIGTVRRPSTTLTAGEG